MSRTRLPHLDDCLTVGGLYLFGFLVYGLGVYGFSQFLDPIAKDFHWGRSAIGAGMSVFWLAAPVSLLVAHQLDRIGPKRILVAGGLIEAAGLAAITLCTNETQFFALRLVMGIGKVLIAVPIPILIARWFPRRAGLVVAIALSGWHAGGIILAPVAAHLIATFGWRSAALILSAGLAAAICIAGLMIRKDSSARAPAECPGSHDPQSLGGGQHDYRGMGIFLLVVGVFYSGYAALFAHISPILLDHGLTLERVGYYMALIAICAMLGEFVGGLVTQILPPRLSIPGLLILIALAETLIVSQGIAGSHATILLAICLIGLLVGCGDPILIETLRRLVSPERFDTIYSRYYLYNLAILALAPIAAGASYDRTGSYALAFHILAALSVVLALAYAIPIAMRKRGTA